MEGSSATAQHLRRDPATVRVTRLGVVIAAIGALLVIFDAWGLAIAGLVMTVIGALLAARGGWGHRWYWMLCGGALIVVLSRPIAEEAQVLGGWLAVAGCVLVLIGASLGYPLASDLED